MDGFTPTPALPLNNPPRVRDDTNADAAWPIAGGIMPSSPAARTWRPATRTNALAVLLVALAVGLWGIIGYLAIAESMDGAETEHVGR